MIVSLERGLTSVTRVFYFKSPSRGFLSWASLDSDQREKISKLRMNVNSRKQSLEA